jgi:anti-sigma B factor antagonist
MGGAEQAGPDDVRVPQPRFTVDVRTEGDLVTLRVGGELDLAVARRFRAALYPYAGPGRTVELDLTGLEFLDSSGLQLLVSAAKSARADGWTLRIKPPAGRARQALTIAGMERVLPIV